MNPPIQKALDFVKARRAAGLSDETMHVLLAIFHDGEGTKDQLAVATGINPTTLPRYLTGLLASGHVVKRPDEEDRRAVLFALSAHGARLVESLLKHFPADD
jgi:DNA-binding MarR family transcriptional regulator